MNRLVFILLYPFLFFISSLPFWAIFLFSDVAYVLVYYIIGYRKKVVRKNIQLAGLATTPQKQVALEKKFYKYLCDLFLEAIKVNGMSKKDMMRRFTIKNPEVLEKFAAEGKSVFMLIGHYGNFEWMLSIGYHVPHIPYAIYAPLENKSFDNYFKRVRSKHGSYLISRKRFAKEFTKMQHTNTLGLIGFAGDQSPQKKAKNYYRTFFGHEVPVFTGAERLGKEFDVPVVMGKIKRLKRGYYETSIAVLAENPNSLPDYQITDTYYEELEKQIKEDPSVYFWTHNRFKLMRQKS